MDSLPRLEDLTKDGSSSVDVKGLLSQTVVLKLNGGLGTSMVSPSKEVGK